MSVSDIARLRLHNQQIASNLFEKPGEVVEWLGAVQAQDYLGALWGIGLRMQIATEEDIEGALASRTIIRTWPMRGTLHFVAATDARWMLELLTPRVLARHTLRHHQQYGLDDAVFARYSEVFVRALQGGKQLTRNAMYQALESAHISPAGGRGLQILWRLAQDGLICFGARQGKQQTFVLLDEWAPNAKRLERDEALAELARRYFTGHGPATLKDFTWWSGLAAADAQAGLEMVKQHLVQEVVDGQPYWLSSSMPTAKDASLAAYMLPAYDEYTIAYKDRSAVLNPIYTKRAFSENGISSPAMVINGQVVGSWKRTLKKDSVVITPDPFKPLNEAENQAVAAAAHRYGAFLDVPVVLA